MSYPIHMQRWSSIYALRWAPILTFERRRTEWLDWVESNLEVSGFKETEKGISVSLGRPTQGIVLSVERSFLVIEDAIGSGIQTTETALQGIFQIFEPQNLRRTHIFTAYSKGIPDIAYDIARGRFARAISLGSFDDSLSTEVDASALIDLKLENAELQIEWGIVSSKELVDRLSNDDLGRLSSNRPSFKGKIDSPPHTSIFTDLTMRLVNQPNFLTSSSEVLEATGQADSNILETAQQLANTLQVQMRGE